MKKVKIVLVALILFSITLIQTSCTSNFNPRAELDSIEIIIKNGEADSIASHDEDVDFKYWIKDSKIIKTIQSDADWQQDLKYGLSPTPFKEIFSALIHGFDTLKFGFSKFIEFLRFACKIVTLRCIACRLLMLKLVCANILSEIMIYCLIWRNAKPILLNAIGLFCIQKQTVCLKCRRWACWR